MEFNNNKINKSKIKFRSKSLASNFLNKLKAEKRNSNNLSSFSKNTPVFNERNNIYRLTSKSMPIDISKHDEILKFKNSYNTNQLNKSQEISMQNIKDKNDVNVNCTNINISIVNPNFSINNFESRNSASNINTNKINVNIINNSLLSFNDNNDKIERNVSKIKSEREKAQILTSIYKDYLENKSQDESFSFNFGDETMKKKFKNYLNKNKIVQHEFKTKGIISGFSAYMYQNEETINKDKICLNINVDKPHININKGDESEINISSHIINFFGLFSGGRDDNSDDLPKILKNKLNNMILNNKDIINCPEAAIKKGLFNIELDYINYFIEEKIDETKNFFTVQNENLNKIPLCSIMILLNIDDIFYIANIGKIITILSSNYSQTINYLAKEHIFQNLNLYESIEKGNINEINNFIELSNSNIILDKSYSSLLNPNIYNQIFPQLNIIRGFPGNALHRIIERKYNLIGMNNIFLSHREIYDKFKRRSSATFINLINVLNNQRGKNPEANNHINESYLIRNSNLIMNSTESVQEKKMISSYPDVLSYRYQKNHDFILICSNTILENINYETLCKGVYETMKKCIKKKRSFEIFLGCVVKDIIKKSISLGVKSNISCMFICFESIKNLYLKYDINKIENEIVSFYLVSNGKKKFELYENILNIDLIDIDKACKYENKLRCEYNKLVKRKKSTLSAINIGSDKNKIIYNNFINGTNQTMDINKKNKNENKKNNKKCRCSCIIF